MAFIVVVGMDVLKLFVPVHTLLLDGLTNDCAFSVVKLTNSFAAVADTAHEGITLNVTVCENVVFPRIVFTPTLEPITIAPPASKLLYIEFVVVSKLANRFLV
jgi:hypothetical protein